jgi:hypothetical protein
VVVDLFSGPMGVCRLGYVKSGADAGRTVLLREVSPQSLRFLGRRLRKASEIAHSNLVKLLGTVEVDGRVQIASEYVAGVSLLELRAATADKRERLEPAVATRIIARALDAAKNAHALCQAKGFELTRSIFSDTVWIAEFGETMLTDVGLADLLGAGNGASAAPTQLVGSGPGSHDVYAAGSELYELLTGKPFHGGIPSFDPTTPQAIAAIVSRALAFEERLRFASISEMTTAFAELPRELVAHEDLVAASIEHFMKAALKLRRAKLGMLERTLGTQDDDGESTRCYSVASLLDGNRGDTVRPPPSGPSRDAGVAEQPLRARSSDAASGAFRSDDAAALSQLEQEDEEATRIMRPLVVAPDEPTREPANPEAKLPTIHVAELVKARRAVTVMMRTPVAGTDDPTLRTARKPPMPKRRVQLIALCVLTLLAAVLALAAFGPRRLGSFLRADHESTPAR